MEQRSGPPLLLLLPLPLLLPLQPKAQPPSLPLPVLLPTPLPLEMEPELEVELEPELDVPPSSPVLVTRPEQATATPPSASRRTRRSPRIPSRTRAS
jgi:hypothetical protein